MSYECLGCENEVTEPMCYCRACREVLSLCPDCGKESLETITAGALGCYECGWLERSQSETSSVDKGGDA
jgi:hypothetical protein